jgi:hypothetical protein
MSSNAKLRQVKSVIKLPAHALNRLNSLVEQRKNLAQAQTALANLSAGEYFVKPTPSKNITQWASPDLVGDILDGKISAKDDPRQKEFGFKTKQDYEFWSWRICGLMSVKAVLDAYGQAPHETVASLTLAGEKLGGYDVQRDRGWFYKPLIKLAERFGVTGGIYGRLSPPEIAADILNKRFVVASVHPSVIRGDAKKNPHDGKGHLVLVWGFRYDGGRVTGFYIQNPSGRKKSTQVRTFVPIDHFNEAFVGRGFWLKQEAS